MAVFVILIHLRCWFRFRKALPTFVSTLVHKVDLRMLLKMRSHSRLTLAEYVLNFGSLMYMSFFLMSHFSRYVIFFSARAKGAF